MAQSIILPRIMQVGAAAIDLLPQTLASLDCHFPCIITDQTMLSLGYVDKLVTLLDQSQTQYGLFSETMPEPNDISILAAVQQVQDNQYDCLIALGGGSAIDSAKAIALLTSHGGKISDYKVPYVVNQISLPIIAIPTTAGTGSEATRVTVIADSATDEKMLCMGAGLMPAAAIIDYELTLSLPPRIAADTGIDALTHAIEAYVSRKANPFTDQQAIAAIKLIAPNLITACQQPTNLKAKEQMMLGATLAGIAFSNASVALVHGMSRPIGVHFHVPHGMSNAMLLPSVTKYSLLGSAKRYAEVAVYMGLVDDAGDERLAHQRLLEELSQINRSLKVPSLAEFGIHKSQYFALLPLMAEQALASGSPNNNPLIPTIDDIIRLYQQAWYESDDSEILTA